MSAPWLVLVVAMVVSLPLIVAVLALAAFAIRAIRRPAEEYLDEVQRACRDAE